MAVGYNLVCSKRGMNALPRMRKWMIPQLIHVFSFTMSQGKIFRTKAVVPSVQPCSSQGIPQQLFNWPEPYCKDASEDNFEAGGARWNFCPH